MIEFGIVFRECVCGREKVRAILNHDFLSATQFNYYLAKTHVMHTKTVLSTYVPTKVVCSNGKFQKENRGKFITFLSAQTRTLNFLILFNFHCLI